MNRTTRFLTAFRSIMTTIEGAREASAALDNGRAPSAASMRKLGINAADSFLP